MGQQVLRRDLRALQQLDERNDLFIAFHRPSNLAADRRPFCLGGLKFFFRTVNPVLLVSEVICVRPIERQLVLI